MSTADIKKEMEAIGKALESFQEGVSIEELKKAAGLDIELRTLQRRLAELTAQGIVAKTGDKRSTKWHLAKKAEAHQTKKENEPEELIPLTTRSKQVLSHVSRPIQQRKPVSYKIDFLRSYRPNIDSYLSAE